MQFFAIVKRESLQNAPVMMIPTGYNYTVSIDDNLIIENQVNAALSVFKSRGIELLGLAASKCPNNTEYHLSVKVKNYFPYFNCLDSFELSDLFDVKYLK